MVVLFCKKVTTVLGNTPSHEGNESACGRFEAKPLTTNYANLVAHVFKAFLQSFVYICQD